MLSSKMPNTSFCMEDNIEHYVPMVIINENLCENGIIYRSSIWGKNPKDLLITSPPIKLIKIILS